MRFPSFQRNGAFGYISKGNVIVAIYTLCKKTIKFYRKYLYSAYFFL